MFKSIYNWFAGKERTVETIIASYVKTVEDLFTHAQDKTIAAAQHAQDAAVAEAKRVDAEAEAAKATVLATKIGDLLK